MAAPAPDKDKGLGEDSAELNAPAEQPAIRKLGRYEIVRELGRGGFGIVFLAKDPKIGRYVAIKTIATGDLRQSGGAEYERLWREAHSAGILSHPGIVTVHELDEEGSTTYIVMQYVNGHTLADRMADPPLTKERILEVLQQAASALDYAHSKGILHRDVKPANIMIDEEGFVKIADFGIAKIVGMATQTKTVSSAGTPYYMSPEQIRSEPMSGRSDQFSLAVVAYELWAGKRPFQGDSLASLMHQILTVEVARVDRMKGILSPAVGDVLEKGLAKEPENRFPTCSAFVSELARAASSDGVIAGSDALAQTLSADLSSKTAARERSRLLPRGRKFWALASLLALAVIVPAGVYSYSRYQDRYAPPRITYATLSDHKGQILFPTLSPDRESLLFASKSSGSWDVFAQRMRDGGIYDLTQDSDMSGDTDAAYSHDGKWIAFRSERDGGGIFVMESKGGVPRRLTTRGYNPQWSPDDRMICFASEGVWSPADRFTKDSKLYEVDLTGGEPSLLYQGDAVQPSWSPHSRRIAFWFANERTAIRDIATVAPGGQPVLVTNDAATDWNPVWSPDGRYLYFASDRGGEFGLWRVRIDETTGKTLAAPQSIRQPGENPSYLSFSGDGNSFTYVSLSQPTSIKRIKFDPVAGAVVGSASSLTEGTRAARPDITPDGKWLAFTSGSDAQQIVILEVGERGSMQELAVGPQEPSASKPGARTPAAVHIKDSGPRWSPDHQHLAFFSNRGGGWHVWVMDKNGKNFRQLIDRDGALYPVWSPAGDRLVYTVAKSDGFQSWVATLGQNGKVAREESLAPRGDPGVYYTPWSWSPNGLYLAGYDQGVDGRMAGITIYDFSTRQFTRLTDAGSDPIWLRDSQRVLFLHDGNIYLADVRKPNSKTLVLSSPPFDIARRGFSITRDNGEIYFSLQEPRSVIWMGTLK